MPCRRLSNTSPAEAQAGPRWSLQTAVKAPYPRFSENLLAVLRAKIGVYYVQIGDEHPFIPLSKPQREVHGDIRFSAAVVSGKKCYPFRIHWFISGFSFRRRGSVFARVRLRYNTVLPPAFALYRGCLPPVRYDVGSAAQPRTAGRAAAGKRKARPKDGIIFETGCILIPRKAKTASLFGRCPVRFSGPPALYRRLC